MKMLRCTGTVDIAELTGDDAADVRALGTQSNDTVIELVFTTHHRLIRSPRAVIAMPRHRRQKCKLDSFASLSFPFSAPFVIFPFFLSLFLPHPLLRRSASRNRTMVNILA